MVMLTAQDSMISHHVDSTWLTRNLGIYSQGDCQSTCKCIKNYSNIRVHPRISLLSNLPSTSKLPLGCSFPMS